MEYTEEHQDVRTVMVVYTGDTHSHVMQQTTMLFKISFTAALYTPSALGYGLLFGMQTAMRQDLQMLG